MDKGFIKLSRSFFDNEIWQAARAFSECEAWIDLIQSARFEASPTTSRIGSYEVTWERGQYPASNRFLAKKWNRSEQWVKTFLGKLKRKNMITTDCSKGVNVITLVNYEKYNAEYEEKPLNSPLSNPLNNMTYNELQGLLTHLLTHLSANSANLQPTPNPKTKKEEELEKESTPNGVPKKAGLSLPSPSFSEDGNIGKVERTDYGKGMENLPPTPHPPSRSDSGKVERIDYGGLMETFNRMFEGKLPRVTIMTDKRKDAVRARVAEHGKEAVMAVFREVLQSAFLLGHNERNWICDFDWIFRPTNFVKVLEGNYKTGNNGIVARTRTAAINQNGNGINQSDKEARAKDAASIIARLAAQEGIDDSPVR